MQVKTSAFLWDVRILSLTTNLKGNLKKTIGLFQASTWSGHQLYCSSGVVLPRLPEVAFVKFSEDLGK